MPYGISKKLSPAKRAIAEKKTESCVPQVQKSGKDKVAAIKICKSAVTKSVKK